MSSPPRLGSARTAANVVVIHPRTMYASVKTLSHRRQPLGAAHGAAVYIVLAAPVRAATATSSGCAAALCERRRIMDAIMLRTIPCRKSMSWLLSSTSMPERVRWRRRRRASTSLDHPLQHPVARRPSQHEGHRYGILHQPLAFGYPPAAPVAAAACRRASTPADAATVTWRLMQAPPRALCTAAASSMPTITRASAAAA